MFTTKNYFEKIKEIDVENLPDNLQEAYEFVKEVTQDHITWDYYYSDKDVKANVDQYLADLSDYVKNQKPTKGKAPVKKATSDNATSSGEPTEEQAKNAAKELIKSYVLRGDTYESLKESALGVSKDAYSASIKNNHIHVDKVNGKVFIRTFPLKSIMNEILKDNNVTPPSLEQYKELAKEIAKNLIRPYVKQGSGYKTLLTSSLGKSDGINSAEIKGGKIHVTKVLNKEVKFSFAVQAIYEEIQEEQPAPKSSTKPKKGKASAPAKKGSAHVPSQDAKPVERVDEDIRFIKRFVLLHGKTKTDSQILNFINALQKAILEKRIRKTSPYSHKIEYIQDNLITLYNRMGETVVVTIRKENLDDLIPIAGSEKVRLSVGYMKRYIGIQGKHITKEKATKLYNFMETAINKGRITGNDPYMEKMKRIVASLRNFATKARKNETLQIHEAVLNGINEALDGCECCTTKSGKKKELSQGFEGLSLKFKNGVAENAVMSSMELSGLHFETLGFTGMWLEFFGDPSPGFSVMVSAKPKFGKSTLCAKFAGYLAREHGSVLLVAKEEGLGHTLRQKLEAVKHPDLHVTATLPDNLEPYDFVVLDSVTRLGLRANDLRHLRAMYPSKNFIFVFQVTKSGQFRGDNDFAHDVDSLVTFPELGKAVQMGRFNQGGEMEIFSDQHWQAA